jgi:hypothetical protein
LSKLCPKTFPLRLKHPNDRERIALNAHLLPNSRGIRAEELLCYIRTEHGNGAHQCNILRGQHPSDRNAPLQDGKALRVHKRHAHVRVGQTVPCANPLPIVLAPGANPGYVLGHFAFEGYCLAVINWRALHDAPPLLAADDDCWSAGDGEGVLAHHLQGAHYRAVKRFVCRPRQHNGEHPDGNTE